MYLGESFLLFFHSVMKSVFSLGLLLDGRFTLPFPLIQGVKYSEEYI